MNENDSKPKVLIIGGGIAGLESALALKGICGDRAEIGLIAPKNTYTYRPLAVAEPFGLAEHFRINLGVFATSREVDLQLGEVDRVDTDGRVVHTTNGTSYDYDFLIAATGANRKPTLSDAISFVDFDGVTQFKHMLFRLERGEIESVVFCAGATVGWFLPMYELALMTATFADERNVQAEISVVTPESAPLVAFGTRNSADVANLLESAGIQVRTGEHPVAFEDGELRLIPEGAVAADEVVAMPTLEGPSIPGLPADQSGFIPVDEACRIEGHEREFAAGDATNFPVKQGGIAAQMAHAAVRAIAVELGALSDAEPFRPTLDGTLLTGKGAHHLHQSLTLGVSEESSRQHLSSTWLPMAKVTAPFLVDYLAEHSDFPSGRGELRSDEIAEGLSDEWERPATGP
ncbi:MAG TPA: FAD-dependent oxidoreductase [Solirubrobacterales bacterium]